jgi:hypothetical protein
VKSSVNRLIGKGLSSGSGMLTVKFGDLLGGEVALGYESSFDIKGTGGIQAITATRCHFVVTDMLSRVGHSADFWELS